MRRIADGGISSLHCVACVRAAAAAFDICAAIADVASNL
jgi:hypothetical protein